MSSFKDAKVVGIGTGSQIKIDALREAFGGAIEVRPKTDAQSGVSAQPVGKEETSQGAFNRAEEARAAFPDADAWVGIENGVWDVDPPVTNAKGQSCPQEDAACVAVLLPAASGDRSEPPRRFAVWSDVLPVPEQQHLPFGRGRDGEWSELKDPHAVLTDGQRPRKAFLVDALRQAIADVA